MLSWVRKKNPMDMVQTRIGYSTTHVYPFSPLNSMAHVSFIQTYSYGPLNSTAHVSLMQTYPFGPLNSDDPCVTHVDTTLDIPFCFIKYDDSTHMLVLKSAMRFIPRVTCVTNTWLVHSRMRHKFCASTRNTPNTLRHCWVLCPKTHSL